MSQEQQVSIKTQFYFYSKVSKNYKYC